MKKPAPHSDYLKYSCEGIRSFADLSLRLSELSAHYMELAHLDAQMETIEDGWINYTIPGHDIDVDPEDGWINYTIPGHDIDVDPEDGDMEPDMHCQRCYQTG